MFLSRVFTGRCWIVNNNFFFQKCNTETNRSDNFVEDDINYGEEASIKQLSAESKVFLDSSFDFLF